VDAETGLKTPPHSREAETAVLGAVLVAPESLESVLELLDPTDFYDPGHSLIFQAMIDLSREGRPVDHLTLIQRLMAEDNLSRAGGGEYLAGLDLAQPSSALLNHHAGMVKGLSLRRRLIHRAGRIIRDGFDQRQDLAGVLDRASTAFLDLAQGKTRQRPKSLAGIAERSLKRIKRRSENRDGMAGLATGFTDLDAKIMGLQPGELVVIAGRPGMGKSALAWQMAMAAARESGKTSFFVSAEMSEIQMGDRALAQTGGVPLNAIRSGLLSSGQMEEMERTAQQLAGIPVVLEDSPGPNLDRILVTARRIKRNGGLGLVVVDYLQLMTGPLKERREQEVSAISRGLKGLAKELETPVVAVSQLNRKAEDRPDKRPRLTDLRESGAIEQDADLVLFIFRDEAYHPRSDGIGTAEVIIAKHRQGPTGTLKLSFNKALVRFDNLNPDIS
jgi:replicative DNA helicase